jgi:hypothetical protein
MNQDPFDKDINTLNLLACNHETLEAFENLYKKMIETVYNDMHLIKNTERLLLKEYRAKGEMLKTIMKRQVDFMGIEWPEDRPARTA